MKRRKVEERRRRGVWGCGGGESRVQSSKIRLRSKMPSFTRCVHRFLTSIMEKVTSINFIHGNYFWISCLRVTDAPDHLSPEFIYYWSSLSFYKYNIICINYPPLTDNIYIIYFISYIYIYCTYKIIILYRFYFYFIFLLFLKNKNSIISVMKGFKDHSSPLPFLLLTPPPIDFVYLF